MTAQPTNGKTPDGSPALAPVSGSVALRSALDHLYNVGLACRQCGWGDSDLLWCTDTHAIRVKHLLALGEIIKKHQND